MSDSDQAFGSDPAFGDPALDGSGLDGSGVAFGTDAGQTAVKVRPEPKAETDREQPVPWNVVLLDDDDHSYEYVIRMAQQLFGMTLERAFQLAKTVDAEGRAVCTTTHKELAELKQEQIHCFGPDPLMSDCKGAMSAVIEPAQGGDESGNGSGDDAEDQA